MKEVIKERFKKNKSNSSKTASRKKVTRPRTSKKTVDSSLTSTIRGAVKSALIGGGGMLGALVGAPQMGAAAGALVSKVIGSGDYTVNKNSLVGSNGIPVFSNTPRGFRIAHKEFITDIVSSVGFSNSTYAINPGNPVLFPYLSIIAAGFQEYRIHGMLVCFNSTSASALNSTNTALGTVIMATNYNVARPGYASKVEMEASEFSCSSKPSESFMHPIECAPAETPLEHLYIRTGPVPSGQDPRFYDWGLFQIATVGMQAAANIGEAWVTYDIEFYKFRLPSAIGIGESFDWAFRKGTTYSNTDPFNTAGLTVTMNGGLGATVNNLVITLPSSVNTGTWAINCEWVGNSTACVLGAQTVSANASFNTEYDNGTGQASNGSTTTTTLFYSAHINVNSFSSTGTTLTLSSLTLPASGTYFVLSIMPVPLTPNSSPY